MKKNKGLTMENLEAGLLAMENDMSQSITVRDWQYGDPAILDGAFRRKKRRLAGARRDEKGRIIIGPVKNWKYVRKSK